MANSRKLTCDCGGIYETKEVNYKGFRVKATVCQKCGARMFNIPQARKLYNLIKLHNLLDKERKIVRIGNSLGITLPESLKEFGIEVGRKVKIVAVAPNSLKIVLV